MVFSRSWDPSKEGNHSALLISTEKIALEFMSGKGHQIAGSTEIVEKTTDIRNKKIFLALKNTRYI